MTALEIILLVCGIACVAVSFIISDKKEETKNIESNELNDKQKEEIKEQINKLVIDEIAAVHDRTEAQLDKISNTKILELSEYAETILGEINRNHNETVFLYDMLNEKAKEVKNTVKDVNITRRQMERIQVGAADQNASDSSTSDSDETRIKTNDSVTVEIPSKILAKNRLSNIVKKNSEEGREQAEVLYIKAEQAGLIAEGTKNKQKSAQNNNGEIKGQKSEKNTTPGKSTTKTKPAASNDFVMQNNTAVDDISEINIQFERGTNNNDKILKLFHEGKNNKEIAKALNLGVGEVKLVLDLFTGGK